MDYFQAMQQARDTAEARARPWDDGVVILSASAISGVFCLLMIAKDPSGDNMYTFVIGMAVSWFLGFKLMQKLQNERDKNYERIYEEEFAKLKEQINE